MRPAGNSGCGVRVDERPQSKATRSTGAAYICDYGNSLWHSRRGTSRNAPPGPNVITGAELLGKRHSGDLLDQGAWEKSDSPRMPDRAELCAHAVPCVVNHEMVFVIRVLRLSRSALLTSAGLSRRASGGRNDSHALVVYS